MNLKELSNKGAVEIPPFLIKHILWSYDRTIILYKIKLLTYSYFVYKMFTKYSLTKAKIYGIIYIEKRKTYI